MNDNDWSDLVFNERTGDFENPKAKDKSELIYNWETGEFEDPNDYKEGEVPSFLLTSCIKPPQDFVDLIGDIAAGIASSYLEQKKKALDTIQFIEHRKHGCAFNRRRNNRTI